MYLNVPPYIPVQAQYQGQFSAPITLVFYSVLSCLMCHEPLPQSLQLLLMYGLVTIQCKGVLFKFIVLSCQSSSVYI